MQKVTVKLKVKEGDPCFVCNYRSRSRTWEKGKVERVIVVIRSDGTYRPSYDVQLERKTTGRSRLFPEGGAPIFLHVGNDWIEPYNVKVRMVGN